MTDLVSRLLEAIAETERLARAVDASEAWSSNGLGHIAFYDDGPETFWYSVERSERGDHIAHNDPSSVLRRCEAGRNLVDLHGIVHRDIGWLEWDEGEHAEMYAELPVCGLCVPRHSSFPRRVDVPEGPCRTMRILAEGYGIVVHQEGNDD